MSKDLAIAYNVKRKNRKKFAKGGQVGKNESAKSEARPMPNERDKDAAMVSRNSGNKPPKNDSWSSRPDIAQSQAPKKTQPIKHPKMVPQNLYSVRLRDAEDHLQESASVNEGPQEQPPERYNEEDAAKEGNAVPDMERAHSNGRKPYAKGGPVMQPKPSGIELMEQLDEAHLMDKESPSEDEGESEAHSLNESSPNRQGPDVSDMEHEHSNGRRPYAKGGMAHEMDEQPQPEADIEHQDSIAAAIMARRDRMHDAIDSGAMDLDEAAHMASGGSVESGSPDMNYARGGKIHSHDSIYSDDSDQADLSRNADEDANEEDQLSFNALEKENYSESEGLRQLDNPEDSAQHGDEEEDESEDKHDMVDSIRRKMNLKRQFKPR